MASGKARGYSSAIEAISDARRTFRGARRL